MPDIFDEVEEDLRAEKARRLGLRYAGAGVVALLLILAATGFYVYWQQRSEARANDVANRFIDAAKLADKASGLNGAADAAAAEKPLAAIASSGPEGYRTLARLRLAPLQWQLGQTSAAIGTWQAVSDDPAAPSLLRDMATLASAQHQVDSGDPILLKQRLETLTSPDNRWRAMALQVIALLDIRQGKYHDAALVMRGLSIDPLAPQGIRSMASDLLTTLPADALAATPAQPGAHRGATPPASATPPAHG